MKQIKDLLKARENQLLQMKKDKEEALMEAPKGALRICHSKNRVQYYHRSDPQDYNGGYIRGKDIQLARNLAQKDYDRKVLQTVEKELNAIRKYLFLCPEVEVEEIYENLKEERKNLITPIWKPEDEYVRQWNSVKYQGKGFFEDTPEFYTMKGERVRSKSELMIADLLNRRGIPYRYEYPVYVNGVGKIYPDFTVLNVRNRTELYWEHLGMMDDASYVEKALQKIAVYEKNEIFQGEKLILTYETRKNPLSQKQVVCLMQHYFE